MPPTPRLPPRNFDVTVRFPITTDELDQLQALTTTVERTNGDLLSAELQLLWDENNGAFESVELEHSRLAPVAVEASVKLTKAGRAVLEVVKYNTGLQLKQLMPVVTRRLLARGDAPVFDSAAQLRVEQAASAVLRESSQIRPVFTGGDGLPRTSANLADQTSRGFVVPVRYDRAAGPRLTDKASAYDPHRSPTRQATMRHVVLNVCAEVASGGTVPAITSGRPKGASGSVVTDSLIFAGELGDAVRQFSEQHPEIDLGRLAGSVIDQFAFSDTPLSSLRSPKEAIAAIAIRPPQSLDHSKSRLSDVSLTDLLVELAETVRLERQSTADLQVRKRLDENIAKLGAAEAAGFEAMMTTPTNDASAMLSCARAVNDAKRDKKLLVDTLDGLRSADELLDVYRERLTASGKARGNIDMAVRFRAGELGNTGIDQTATVDAALVSLYEQDWGPWDERYDARSIDDAPRHRLVRTFVEQSLGGSLDFASVGNRPTLELEAGPRD